MDWLPLPAGYRGPKPRTFKTFRSGNASGWTTATTGRVGGVSQTSPHPITVFSTAKTATSFLFLWKVPPIPKRTRVLSFPTRAAPRCHLTSPQSHSTNQNGQSAPTSPTSNAAFAECLLYTGHGPAFLTYLTLRSNP